VVALHGCAQDAGDFAVATRFDRVAQRAGAYVVYPEQSPLANSRRCWNWFTPEHQLRTGGEPAAILRLIENLCAQHPVDPGRIFVCGFSAGAVMAAILAEQAPDVFGAVATMAGVPLHAAHDLMSAQALMAGARSVAPSLHAAFPSRAYRRLRAMIWQGASDDIVAPINATLLVQQFLDLCGQNGVSPHVDHRGDVEIRRWRDPVDDIVRVEEWRVAGMRHAWSGGSPRAAFTWPPGPHASEETMAFFLRHPLVRRETA